MMRLMNMEAEMSGKCWRWEQLMKQRDAAMKLPPVTRRHALAQNFEQTLFHIACGDCENPQQCAEASLPTEL